MVFSHTFLQSISTVPDDDTPRLIYADWLEEVGDLDQANFIRYQIALAKDREPDLIDIPLTNKRYAALDNAAEQLLKKHRDEWEADIRQALGDSCQEVIFHRGFPSEIHVKNVRKLIGSNLLNSDTSTVTGLKVENLVGDIPDFFAHPGLSRLRKLSLYNNLFENSDAVILAACPYLQNLTSLDLCRNRLSDDGIVAIANSPHLSRLNDIDITINWEPVGRGMSRTIGNRGINSIMDSTTLSAEAKHSVFKSLGYTWLVAELNSRIAANARDR